MKTFKIHSTLEILESRQLLSGAEEVTKEDISKDPNKNYYERLDGMLSLIHSLGKNGLVCVATASFFTAQNSQVQEGSVLRQTMASSVPCLITTEIIAAAIPVFKSTSLANIKATLPGDWITVINAGLGALFGAAANSRR